MTTVIIDFEKRAKEIIQYYNLLEKIIVDDAVLYLPKNTKRKKKKFGTELVKVMKANIFLLLYNLAESSIKQSLSEIYDSITDESVKYEDVKDEIKKIWIKVEYKNFNQTGTNRIFETLNQIAQDIINIEFSQKRISGNIDARKIKEFAKEIGFSTRCHHSLNNGAKLHQVKTQRNKLAHGELSFAECGRSYTISDLKSITNQVIKYLRRILLNIQKYISSKDYLK